MIDYETESNINRDISFRFQKEDDQKNGEFFLNKILIEDEDDDIELIGEDFNNIIDCIYNNEMFTLNSGNKLTVQDVKTSYLTYYSEDKTIEEAFSNYSYFDDISWEEFDGTLDNGENVDIVEFDAEIKMYDYETEFDVTEDISFQFYRDDNMKGDESQIYGIFIGDEEYDELIQLDDYDFVDIINCIYEDEQFVFMGEDYGVHY